MARVPKILRVIEGSVSPSDYERAELWVKCTRLSDTVAWKRRARRDKGLIIVGIAVIAGSAEDPDAKAYVGEKARLFGIFIVRKKHNKEGG